MEEENRPRNKAKARGLARWMLLAALAVVAIVAIWLWRYFAVRESTDDAQIDGHINPVAAKVGGTVLTVYVKDNQKVTAGDILVKIDPRDYEVSLARARAELAAAEAAAHAAGTAVPVTTIATSSQVSSAQALLESAEARVEVASRDVDSARARLAPLQARLREAEALHTKASQDLERMKQLIEKERISRQQYDAAVAAAAAALAARDGAAALVAEADSGIASALARLEQAHVGVAEARAAVQATKSAPEQDSIAKSQALSARARVLQARAALDRAELDLEYTEVKAPVSGVIGMKKVEVGQVVQREQPLLAVVPLDDIWVTANLKETQVKNMRPGQPVEISVDAYGRRKYRGRIDSIAAATGARFSLLPPENATGNFVKVVQRIPVKILFEGGQDSEHVLRPGMSVVPTVLTR